MSRTALILQHGDSGPPAILAEWCAARAIAFEVHHDGPHLGKHAEEAKATAFELFDAFWERAR